MLRLPTLAPALALAALLCSFPSASAPSVVPPSAAINDAQARRELARLYAWSGRLGQAASLYRALLETAPRDPELRAGLAEVELARGHAAASRDGFARAVALAPQDEALRLRQAQAMNLWGDFYRAEAIYRAHLAVHPEDMETRLNLARLLMSAQRFEESRGLYQRLAERGAPAGEVRAALCRVAWEAGDLEACLARGREALTLEPDQPEVLKLMGQASLRLGEPQHALACYTRLAALAGQEARGLAGMGRAEQAMGNEDRARKLYAQAHAADPTDPGAWLLALGPQAAAAPEFLDKLTAPGGLKPAELAAWARVYTRHGLPGPAIACLRAALAADPRYFPARLALAETLGVAHEYDQANAMLAELAREFAGASKVLMTQARVLAWSRHYQESVARYEAMHQLNPRDPLPLREGARAALWGKDMAKARELYTEVGEPPLDHELAETVRAQSLTGAGTPLAPALERAARADAREGDHRPVRAYEDLSRSLILAGPKLPLELREDAARVLRALRWRYRVQKAALMERAGKQALWEKRFLRAMHQLQELTAFEPGNQEAWFDLAQAQCSLGLCGREAAAYRALLARDPLHNLAGQALADQQRRSRPRVGAAYSFWHERGYGERAQMTRHQAELGVGLPLACRFNLEAAGLGWWELPTRHAGEARAKGFRLGGGGVLAPWLRASAAWTHKSYDHAELGSRDQGRAQAWANACDWVQVGLGWSREEVLANAFALRQGVMMDSWWLGLDSRLNRHLEAEVRLRYLDYHDGNRGDWESLVLGYDLTDHPRRLKAWLRLEHRDHDQRTREVFQGGALVDMVHPYWAPQGWWGGALGLRWRHDLAKLEFCGAEQHYYELGLAVSDDNESNLGWQAEAAWRYEFAGRWDAEFKGLVHRSREWDADGLWLNLGCRF